VPHGNTANELCTWQLSGNTLQGDFRPQLVFAEDIDFALADDLFGLYPTRREALAQLAQTRRRTSPVPQAARA
jgi:hypothetical protein